MYGTGGFVAGSGFQFCLILPDSGRGEHIPLFLIENKMNEIACSLYGTEEYINEVKSCITRA